MAEKIGSLATSKVVQRLTAASGALGEAQLHRQNVAADLSEQSGAVRYPVLLVYCEKVVNSMAEKFRTFSGTLQMAVEVRQSSDRLEGLEEGLEATADAVTQMLSANRGDWGDGMYYGGVYQVAFAAARRGGRNFLQAAKVTFEIGASIN
jgi:hypothetical protein